MHVLKKITAAGLMMSMLLMAGCWGQEEESQPVNGTQAVYEEVTLYFSDADANYLVPNQRQIQVEDTSNEALAAAIVHELIAGPKENSQLYGIMPPETELQTVEMDDKGVMSVSFNQAFIDKQPGGSSGMTMTVYGLVNSLACLEGVEAVQILIDGQVVEAYQGLISETEPIVPMMEYIQP